MVNILELQTSQTNSIKTLIDTLNSVLTDINITFYPEKFEQNGVQKVGGVMIKELNKTQSILVQCKLDADQFEKYKYNHNQPKLTISINLGNFLKCLKCMSNFDSMTWIIDDEDTNKLHMILESEKDTKTFKINLMDLDNNNYEIEPVKFPFVASLPCSEFQNYCKNMSTATEKLDLRCTEEGLFFEGKGDLGIVKFSVPVSKGLVKIDKSNDAEDDIVQGLFELKYLLIFTKCTNLCDNVNICMKNGFPLIIRYSVSKLGEIKLVLSPCKPDFN
jgi:proliferating cell nuclear antigen